MRFIVARPGACEKVALGSPQGYVKVSQVKQTKQEQISTGYFENDLVGWEREWEDFRRADKGEGIGSAFGAARGTGALAGVDAKASLFGIAAYRGRVSLLCSDEQ